MSIYLHRSGLMKPPGGGGPAAGTLMFVTGSQNDKVYKYTLGTAWDVTSASFDSDFDVSSQDTAPNALFFKPDGSRMYVLGIGNDKVYEYSLGTAWNITTASFVNDFSVSSQDTTPLGLFFKPDGTRMYIIGDATNDVYEYSLGTAWDVTTASSVSNFDVSSQESIPTAVFFKPDGTRMYITGNKTDEALEYSLGTAWDITSASYVDDFSLSSQDTAPNALFFRSDGNRMYMAGSENDKIYEYSLGTAWDITTLSFVDDFDVSSKDTTPTGVFFNGL